MSDQLKFVVEELRKQPFDKTYSLISFDALNGSQLLRIAYEVIAEINGKLFSGPQGDLEQMIMQLINSLHIFKYKPAVDNPEQFRQTLLEMDKHTIHSLLFWLLQRLPDIKKRAYLAKFLVKLDIPQEYMGDVEVYDVYQQYLSLIEEFKSTHKQFEQLRNAGQSTAEIKKDIQNMEDEKRQITKRIDRIKKKVESFPNVGAILEVARVMRQERETEDSLNIQKQEQLVAIHHADQRIQRMSHSLQELRQAKNDSTPESLLQRCEQELQVNSYIAKEKLPKEISRQRQLVADLEKVTGQGDMKKSDLESMYATIQSVNADISRLVEKRMMSGEPMDDKLSMFRQQAAIIGRKKDSTAEVVNELRNELSSLEASIKEKQNLVNEAGGVEILKGDEFKQYVTKLRSKSNAYKKKRQEQSEVRAEVGVLTRTLEILKQQYSRIEQELGNLEAEKGVSGFRRTQDDLEKVSSLKGSVDEQKSLTLTDISDMVLRLNQEIQAKRTALAPVIKELHPIRQQFQDLSLVYDEKKALFNSVSVGLESNVMVQEREVKALEEECNSKESLSYLLKCKLCVSQAQLERANAEMKSYLSGDSEAKKQSLREQYTQHIQEQEKEGKVLREEQKNVKEAHQKNTLQMQMWADLQRLFECKMKCASRTGLDAEPNYSAVKLSGNSQTLAL